MKSMAVPMTLLVTTQVLRDIIDAPFSKEWIDRSVDESREDFLDPEREAGLETVGPNGEFLDHFDGRLSTRMKGNIWKGPFHIPRMQLYCWQVIGEFFL